MLRLLCTLFASILWTAAHAQSVIINEVVSSNSSGIEDEDGDRPDWIELYNPGSASINLSGYGLSDDFKSPFKWRFPLKLIPARGFLTILASGKNRTNSARLHTNFRLSASGETVILTRPDSQVVDIVHTPSLLPDFAYGRQPDGSSNLLYLATPTPSAQNRSASGRALLHPPICSHEAGWYDNALDISLVSSDLDAAIHYTLDGAEPSLESPLYTVPIRIVDRNRESNGISLIQGTSTNNQHTDGWKPPKGLVRKLTVVRARAFRDDALPSQITTKSFAIGPATNSGLPVISLSVAPAELFDFNRGIYMLGQFFYAWRNAHPTEVLTGHSPANYTQRGPDWERPAYLEFFNPARQLEFGTEIRLDIQGQSSRSFRQKSLGIKTRPDPINYPIFPGLRRHGDGTSLLQFSHLRLRNSGNDWVYTMFRDALCHRLADGLGFDTEAYRPALVFLDGEYWGLHNIREQRDAQYLASHYGVRETDAVICSGDGSLVEGPAGANQPFLNLREFIRTHELSVAANFEKVAQQIDIRNFILYHAACIYFGNADWPHNNVNLWRDRSGSVNGGAVSPRDGRWRWMLFDCDLAYGHPWTGGVSDPTLAAVLSPSGRVGLGTDAGWSTLLFRGLMQNPEFRQEFINTSADLLNSWFRESRAVATVESMRSVIAPAMPEHFARWQTQAPTNMWTNEVKVLTSFARQRPIVLRQQYVVEMHLAGYTTLTVDVSDPAAGRVRVNQLTIDATLPGVEAAPYPWRGWYFREVPVELEALANPGWEFGRWEVSPQPQNPAPDPTARISLTDPANWKAIFVPARPRIVKISSISPNRLRADMQGTPNHSYRVETSPDLIGWISAGVVAMDSAGLSSFEWNLSAVERLRFLRLVATP